MRSLVWSCGLGFRLSGLGFRVSGLGFRGSGLGLRFVVLAVFRILFCHRGRDAAGGDVDVCSTSGH